MALNIPPMRTGTNDHGSFIVELSNRQLPVRMRAGSMRSSLRTTRPWVGRTPRILAVSSVLALRFFSRDSGRIDLTLP